MKKFSVAIHKFSSCDGCQLAFLNLGDDLLKLATMVDIRHFAEAGQVDVDAPVDISFVEGSVATPDDVVRIKKVRENCNYLITIGACATSGGIQALRNLANVKQWTAAVYASPQHISSLDKSSPIRDYANVDYELWGCPVNSRQIVTALRALLFNIVPAQDSHKLCMECKRQNVVCVMVTKGEPCMGPVTRSGCGALCPSFGRDCYACYGPGENINSSAFANRLQGLGLTADAIAQRFLSINNNSDYFAKEARKWVDKSSE